MSEIKNELYEELREKNLTKRVPIVSAHKDDSMTRYSKMCGDVHKEVYPNINDISDRIRWALQFRGISMRGLASKIGKSEKTVSAYCCGRNSVPAVNIEKIARACNVPSEWLSGDWKPNTKPIEVTKKAANSVAVQPEIKNNKSSKIRFEFNGTCNAQRIIDILQAFSENNDKFNVHMVIEDFNG